MTSRLDRLFILLDSGSSTVTRRAAAKQIGEVQKLHPHELHNLLNRLITFLHSTSWDTRIAAAQAVEAILSNVPQWQPIPSSEDEIDNKDLSIMEFDTDGNLSFANFDLAIVLEKGARLMGSEGTEFDVQDDLNLDDRERLLFQRQLLNERLGLKTANTFGINMNDLVTIDDVQPMRENYEPNLRLMPVQDILNDSSSQLKKTTDSTTNCSVYSSQLILAPSSTSSSLLLSPLSSSSSSSSSSFLPLTTLSSSSSSTTAALSCREINRAKRKARQNQLIITTNTSCTAATASSSSSISSSSSCSTSGISTNRLLYSSSGSLNSTKKLHRSNSINNGLTSTSNVSMNASIADKLDVSQEPDCKRLKLEYKTIDDPVPDGTGSWPDTVTHWPLETFCSKLYLDLFNARWEIRHGAATALRELVKLHSKSAGKNISMTVDEMNRAHLCWLEDIALRLLCVLALDRFGDFISDQVVAPVRETCAQVLGAIMKEMPVDIVTKTVETLMSLIKQNEWEVRHGGLLGIKYMLVVRDDLLQTFLPMTIKDILLGLFDTVDDVGAVAASTLIPIATWLPKLFNLTQVSSIVKVLWDLLLDQDELTAACNSFMGLLAAILSLENSNEILMEPMSVLIPRLWPFLSHTTSSVRRSTLQTLKTLTMNVQKTKLTNESVATTDVINTGSNNVENDLNNIINFDAKKLQYNFGVHDWSAQLLQEALRHIYQRILVEHIEDIQNIVVEVWHNLITNADLTTLLHAACPYVSTWMCLAMQPARLAFDSNLMIFAKQENNRERRSRLPDLDSDTVKLHPKMFLGGIETTSAEIREKNIPRARCNASKMLGLLSNYLVLPAPGVVYTPEIEQPIDCYTKILIGYLSSRSALQRLITGMIIAFWASNDEKIRPGPKTLQEKLNYSLFECVYYDEVAISLTRLVQESRDFIATLKQYKIYFTEFDNCTILSFDQIQALCTKMTENLKVKYTLKPKMYELIEERRRSLQSSYVQTSHDQNSLHISTQAILACATVAFGCLPDRLNPVVRPLMESIKQEACEIFQQISAQYLVKLLDLVSQRTPCPNDKIVKNLCTLLKCDEDFTPKINFTDPNIRYFNPNNPNMNYQFDGILTLSNQQKNNETQNGGSGCSGGGGSGCAGGSGSHLRGPGRPLVNNDGSVEDTSDSLVTEEPSRKLNRIQRIGSTYTIRKICEYFGVDLAVKIPIIWNYLYNHIEKSIQSDTGFMMSPIVLQAEYSNELITCLQLIELTADHLHPTLRNIMFNVLDKLAILLRHPFKVIRHMSARCLATLAALNTSKVMDLVICKVLPLLQIIESVICRQGTVEAIACIVNKLQFEIVPYVVLLVVPLLGRMSDSDQSVRLMSAHCFATLIQLMPLDSDVKNELSDGNLSLELQLRKRKDRQFLDYLFSPKKIPNFNVPVPINAELRSYQQAGINWLWFLNKYKLHGILCDDMGLGKTLQTICILAGVHYERRMENLLSLPSLVICPPTLTGHWVYEVNKFLSEEYLRPLHYVGLPIDRERLRFRIQTHNLVIASYDIVRKDIEFFSSIKWNYVVLDEGHIIKNGNTKCSKAIKRLIANHRLILSGTPIQNNVLELWSLFDFLMPGFLGTAKQFTSKYNRPIFASRDPKSSAKDQEAGALAMESLHRQVLPFLLRRVKEDVLTDLPPKITQDLLCELSPLQERLYEDFSRSHLKSNIKNCLERLDDKTNIGKSTHVFQALRYLQNVCNHPKLVLNSNHPEYLRICSDLKQANSSLDDIEHSAKLPVLKQLLLDCGIGVEGSFSSVNQHRALIFCQLKTMLNIVENDLLKKHLPAVTYLRLDGSVAPSSRHHIVNKFNSDPSIDVLLLTTQVGGLGLNLTGADTVIFVEHDWNPMKDLQAMDRAHRIGQKKVVNVYRLITSKSLEEKIMGLQKFKILTANTVVSDENASMETMGTDQLLDLFSLSETSVRPNSSNNFSNQRNNNNGSIGDRTEKLFNNNNNNNNKSNISENCNASGQQQQQGVSMKQILETLPELWEDRQYEEEYDLTQFLQSLQ